MPWPNRNFLNLGDTLGGHIAELDGPRESVLVLLDLIHEMHGGVERNAGLCNHERCVEARRRVGLPS